MNSINHSPTAANNTYTLGEWLYMWHKTYKEWKVKPQTAKRERQNIALICTCAESQKPLAEITELNLTNILITLQQRVHHDGKLYSKSTLKKVKEILGQALQQAKRYNMISDNIWATLQTPTAPQKKILPLSHWQQDMIEKACQDDPQGHLIIFLLRTGLRRAELINLKWADYDAEAATIYIRKSKTEAGIRTVYLVKEAQQIIEAQPKRGAYIFYNTRNTPISDSSLNRLVERLRAVTYIDTFTCHVCRHTFVTRLCEKGVPAKAIAQIIGHAHTGYVLDIYAMLEQKELRRAIYALEDDKQYLLVKAAN